MLAATGKRRYTVEDYFGAEMSSPMRHEFFDGAIYAMAGGTDDHNTLSVNVLAAFHQQLRRHPCRPLGSDQRLVTPSGLWTYPDVAIYCPPHEYATRGGAEGDTLRNPVVLVEVLSDSTRDYDQTDKLSLYKSVPSLREVLFVEQHAVRIEQLMRVESRWTSRVYESLEDVVRLESMELELSLRDAYERVFPRS